MLRALAGSDDRAAWICAVAGDSSCAVSLTYNNLITWSINSSGAAFVWVFVLLAVYLFVTFRHEYIFVLMNKTKLNDDLF